MPKHNPLKIIGIVVIIIGALIMISVFLVQSLSIVSFGNGLIQADLPPTSATRLVLGFILGIFGLILYYSKELVRKVGD